VCQYGDLSDIDQRVGCHDAMDQFARTHRSQGGASKNVGWEIVSKLQQFIRAKSEGRITVVTQAKLTRLVQEYTSEKVSRIVGVEYLDLSKVQHSTAQLPLLRCIYCIDDCCARIECRILLSEWSCSVMS